MTRLVWDQMDQRQYEMGIDHGVLYPWTGPDVSVYDAGVPWNGLTSVDEQFVGADREELYFDGVKYMDSVSNRDFQAVLSAFSAPDEFARCMGEVPIVSGFILTGQPKQRFGLSYRTQLDDTDYKLHLVYGATAVPAGKSYQTISGSPSALELQWTIDVVPSSTGTTKESAHISVNSFETTPVRLAALEDTLYGTASAPASLPTIANVMSILGL